MARNDQILPDMTPDFVYEKAPLIEVIAEVHWALKKIESAPNAQLDPYYDLFRETFLEASELAGLKSVQELIPAIVPIEFVASQPQLRLRSKVDAWPLVQIGPGILTSNIVPPYDGWASFSPFLNDAIARLFECYPLAKKTLRISRLHLRYIDGFDESFGMLNYREFSNSMLGIGPTLPSHFVADCVEPNSDISFLLENVFQNKSPLGSTGRVKLSPGHQNGRSAAILELHCESSFLDNSATDHDYICEWFNKAHEQLRIQFDRMTTFGLKSLMGNKKDIQ